MANIETSADLHHLLTRAETVLGKLEQLLSRDIAKPDWNAAVAWVYRRSRTGVAKLQAVQHLAPISFDNLQEIDAQKEKIRANTAQFVAGKPANNVLLTGARGTGKSSLIKACLNHFADAGLRLIEIDKTDLLDLPDILELLQDRPERFIIYCDDLSFEDGELGYKALKSVLDGSIATASHNVLIYATSNRRHLLPEYMQENMTGTHASSGEIHPGEAVEEKISLSERFGLWISFYTFSQDEYLSIVAVWLTQLGLNAAQIAACHQDALVWALERGSRSGRVAYQFAQDYVGRQAAEQASAHKTIPDYQRG